MSKLDDKLKALEALLLAKPVEMLANTFAVPMSLRLLDDWHGEVARARASCGHPLTPDAVPLVLDGDVAAWEQAAMRQQAYLIAVGKAHLEGAAAREAERIAATQPERKPSPRKSPPTFTPSTFGARA